MHTQLFSNRLKEILGLKIVAGHVTDRLKNVT